MMIAHTHTLASSRMTITSFTTRSAWRNSPSRERFACGAATAA
jgi:hypothetical protein